MKMFFVDEQVKKKCWNLRDSYGEICVHCGCCANDKLTRYKARIECIEYWIREEENFDAWDDDAEMRAVQEKNKAANIDYYRRQLRYYQKKLKVLEDEQGKV